MSRSPLPQHYVFKEGTLFEGFENSADWTVAGSAGATAVSNPAQKLTGTQSLKCTVAGDIYIAKSISAHLNTVKTFRLGLYQHSSYASINKIWIWFSSQTRPMNASLASFHAELRPQNMAQDKWSYWVIDRDLDFTCVGGESWANEMKTLQIMIMRAGSGDVSVSLDELKIGMEYSPRLMIAFDDNRLTAYNTAYTYMRDRGIRGTMYAIKNTVGLTNYMTLENLQTMYNDGWAIVNHTVSHPDLTTLDLAGQTAELSGCTDYLVANAMPRAARHVAYPIGPYNDYTMTALAALGMLTGRTSYNYQQYTPINNPYLLTGRTIYSTDSLSAVKGYIDAAYNKGVSSQLIFHKFTDDGTSTWWPADNFRALIDYIIARRVPCVTIDEWYEGLINPRYGSLPPSRILRQEY